MFTQGAVEMSQGGPDIRPPDLLYHAKQFNQQSSMPNYGLNKDIPTLKNYGNASPGWTFWAGGSYYGEPDLKFFDFVGDCRKVQFVVSFIPKAVFASFSSVQLFLYSPFNQQAYELYLGFGTDFCYSQQIVYVDAGLSSFLYLTQMNVAWTGFGNFGPDGRITMIFGIDPTVALDGNGPFNGYYDTQPIPWTAEVNGQPPNDYWFYGSDASFALPSCSNWLSPTSAQDFATFKSSGQPGDYLGIAMYKDTFLTTAEKTFWHKEYDWSEDPGFV